MTYSRPFIQNREIYNLERSLKYFNIYIVNEYEIYILGGSVIGVIIPGIMAQEMDRHGIIRTVSSLMILSIFIKAVVEVIYKAGGVN